MSMLLTKPRPETLTRVRLVPAAIAGSSAAAALLAAYYATLGLLTPASAWPPTEYPVSAWAHRFDLAQFLGTMPFPPVPQWWTWWVGLAIWFGTLASIGVAYAILLAWTLQRSDALKGAGLGAGLGVVLLLGLTVAQGYHPAIMRNALPDTGLLMTGWSIWAPAQLVAVYILYGMVLGSVYRRLTISD